MVVEVKNSAKVTLFSFNKMAVFMRDAQCNGVGNWRSFKRGSAVGVFMWVTLSQWRGSIPPKTYESNVIHLDFVQFRKQHSRCKAILLSIVLSEQCYKMYFISLTVVNPYWDFTTKILLKSPPNLNGWIPPCFELRLSVWTASRVDQIQPIGTVSFVKVSFVQRYT